MNTTKLIDELVSLPVDERALVAESLLQSLIQPDDGIDDLWAKLAQERLTEINEARVNLVDGEAVFVKIRNKFNQ